MSVKTFPFDSTTEDVRTLNAVDQRKMYADVLGDRLVEAFSFVRTAGSMVLFTYSGVVFVNGAYAAFTNESLDLTNTSTTATLVVARVDATMRTTTIAVVDSANKLDGDFVIGGASYSSVNGWSIVPNVVSGYIDGADISNLSIDSTKLKGAIPQSKMAVKVSFGILLFENVPAFTASPNYQQLNILASAHGMTTIQSVVCCTNTANMQVILPSGGSGLSTVPVRALKFPTGGSNSCYVWYIVIGN